MGRVCLVLISQQVYKLLSEKGIEGSSPGLASSWPSNIKGALGELRTAAAYAEAGRKVKSVRRYLGTKKHGSEVDIILEDGTFIEFTKQDIDPVKKVADKLTLFKERGVVRAEFVFGFEAEVPKDWIKAVQQKAANLGISLQLKKIRIYPDGRKGLLPL